VVESIRRENLPADATYIGSVKVEDSQPIKPTEVQRMQLKAIFELAEIKMEDIKALYQQLRSKNLSWVNKGAVFDNITKKNKELDKQFQDVIKVVKGLKMSKHEESQALSELYKKILEFYTEQNKILTEMSGQTQLPKSAQKTQETVSKIIQKYMNEMSKMLMQ
jgi:RNAse (barnase) inhibitor barstar